LFAVLLVPCVALGESQAACPIVPVPKVYRETGRTVRLLGPDAAAIVVGCRATEPERYAAQQFQTLLQRRFKQRLPIVEERAVGAGVGQIFLLGQRGGNEWLDRLCREKKIDLSEKSPGENGFVIEFVNDGPREVVLAGGSDAAGVIFAQNALFDLVRWKGDAIELPAVSVRDWPSIRWRGRAHWRMKVHLAPGAFDSYARYRLNFTDLRDADTPDGYAAMGFPPGFKIHASETNRVLHEAHRRGMFVYGTVACGVTSSQYDAAVKTFQDLIAMGVDGLWISLDDAGAGDDSAVIVRRVLALAGQHGMTGRRVAVTQPAGDYNNIDTPFNCLSAAMPDYAAIQWFFTRPPCKQDLAATRKLGLTLKPAWWHNLFNIQGGFLHNANACQSLRGDGKPAYLEMQPLSAGWGRPGYAQLGDAANHTDTVMLWALYDGWPEEYEVGAMGIWAWNPAAHDWTATRKAVYRDVYGPSAVGAALAFDDKLAALKAMFEMPERHYQPNKGWPPRLKRVSDRPKALALLDELEPLAGTIRARALQETAIDQGRLVSVYLEPMQATLQYARKMAALDYPEYSVDSALVERIYELCDDGKMAEAERLEAEVRPRILRQAANVAEELRGLKGIEDYVAFWNGQVSGIESLAKGAMRRRAAMNAAFGTMLKTGFSRCLVNQRLDPAGYAAWLERLSAPLAGHLVAEIPASRWLSRPARWRGTWCIGSLDWQGDSLTVLAFPRLVASKIGDYAEVRTETPVPKFQGRLRLQLFINDTKIDPLYPKYRFHELWVNDRLAWEEDISGSRQNKEWISVDVSEAAKASTSLAIRFRVNDRRAVGCFGSVTFLGPLRLIESPEKR
jgi:hypothetical protein